MRKDKEVQMVKAKVKYMKLPKPYNGGHREWGMDAISFRLPPELNAKLEEIAYRKKITKSELIRIAIAEYLQKVEKE